MLNHEPKLVQCEMRSKFAQVKHVFIVENRNKKFKFQNFGPNYTSNRIRDAHCQFHQHQTMLKCSKLVLRRFQNTITFLILDEF